MTSDPQIEALERLAKLKADGTLTQAEYDTQKARIVGAVPSPPVYRRLWLVVTLTALILTFWIALILVASGPVYKRGIHGWAPISSGARWTFAGLLGLWLLAVVAKVALFPSAWQANAPVAASQPPASSSTGAAMAQNGQVATRAPAAANDATKAPSPSQATADGPPTCSDPNFRQTVLGAIHDAVDKAAMPRAPEVDQAANNLIELGGGLALTARRSVVANSNGQLKPEEVRVCGTMDQQGDVGLVTVIAIQHDGELGGVIQNTGLPQAVPFGKQF